MGDARTTWRNARARDQSARVRSLADCNPSDLDRAYMCASPLTPLCPRKVSLARARRISRLTFSNEAGPRGEVSRSRSGGHESIDLCLVARVLLRSRLRVGCSAGVGERSATRRDEPGNPRSRRYRKRPRRLRAVDVSAGRGVERRHFTLSRRGCGKSPPSHPSGGHVRSVGLRAFTIRRLRYGFATAHFRSREEPDRLLARRGTLVAKLRSAFDIDPDAGAPASGRRLKSEPIG